MLMILSFPALLPVAHAQSETVRDWSVTQLGPALYLFENPQKKLNALVNVEAVPFADDEAAQFIQSPQFVKDAKYSRSTELLSETSGSVAAHHTKIGDQTVGVIETDFGFNGYEFLMTERIWIHNHLRFDVKIGSRGTVTPTSESHDAVFEEFAQDLGLKAPSKSASILKFLLPEARATWNGETGRSRAGSPQRRSNASSQAKVTDCQSLKKKYPKLPLRAGPPSLAPAGDLKVCGSGAVKAMRELGNSAIAFGEHFAERTGSMTKTCQELAGKPEAYNSFVGRVREWSRAGVQGVLNQVCFPGALAVQTGAAGVSIATGVVKGVYNAGKEVFLFGRAMVSSGGSSNAMYSYLAQRFPSYSCLTDREKTRFACDVLAKFTVMAVAGAGAAGAVKMFASLGEAATSVEAAELSAAEGTAAGGSTTGAAAANSAGAGVSFAEKFLKTGKLDKDAATSLNDAQRQKAGLRLLNDGKSDVPESDVEKQKKMIDDMHAVCSESGFGHFTDSCIKQKYRICAAGVADRIATHDGCLALVRSGVAGQSVDSAGAARSVSEYRHPSPEHMAQEFSKMDPKTGNPWMRYGVGMSEKADTELLLQAQRQFPPVRWQATMTNWNTMTVGQQENAIRVWVKAKYPDSYPMGGEYAIRVYRVFRKRTGLDK